MPAALPPLNALLDYPQVPVPHAQSGPLAGLTLAVKDIFDVAGYRTGCGSPDREAESAPANETAPAIRLLLESGARFVGKTQTDELAYSLMGRNEHFSFPINPAARDRITGGSSSGSAAAVAGGLADIATGSDTGGSIRAPASFCGLIGLRTTHGAIPLKGAMPLAPSFDTFGWFAANIEIDAKVAGILLPGRGHGPVWDGGIRSFHVEQFDALLLGPEEASEYRRMASLAARAIGTSAAARAFSSSIDELYWCFRRLQAWEAWREHGDWILAAPRRMNPAVRERFEFGRTVDEGLAREESARRKAFRSELGALLGNDGILVLPTVPGAAPLASASADGMASYRERALRLLCLSGLAGFPQISLPIGSVEGAPFGLSLLGPPDSDVGLIELGRKILAIAKEATD